MAKITASAGFLKIGSKLSVFTFFSVQYNFTMRGESSPLSLGIIFAKVLIASFKEHAGKTSVGTGESDCWRASFIIRS